VVLDLALSYWPLCCCTFRALLLHFYFIENRFWGILKRERYYGKRFTDRASLVKIIEDYIFYYNTKRSQRNLGVLTPIEKHELSLAA
jgi:hypothetical protein